MSIARALIALAFVVPLAPASACPFHGDIFGEGGGFVLEPIAGGAADGQSAQPVQSREELMARQRELFLARYPQLAAGAAGKPPAVDTSAAQPETQAETLPANR
jgi:hypothetical protein